jgi:hypothetical protein
MSTNTTAFQALLEQLQSQTGKGGGRFYHPPAGKTKARIVLPQGENPLAFYREVTTQWGRTKYLVAAVVLEGPDLGADYKPQLRALVLPLTVIKSLVAYLAEGFDLFDPVQGHGISITREGTGPKDTRYTVNPSPRPIDVSKMALEWPEGGIDEWAKAYNSREEAGAPGTQAGSDKPEATGAIPW